MDCKPSEMISTLICFVFKKMPKKFKIVQRITKQNNYLLNGGKIFKRILTLLCLKNRSALRTCVRNGKN